MNAPSRILLYIFFSLSLLFVQGIAVALVLIVLSFIVFFLPGMRGGMVIIFLFVLTTFMGNLFSHSGKVVAEIGSLYITEESLGTALVRTSRVSAMIAGAKLLTLGIPLEEILGALKRFFMPLERIGIPAGEFFDTASLTLKLLPAIRSNAIESYRAGMDGSEGKGFPEKVKIVVALILPLMTRTIKSPGDFLTEGEGMAEGKLESFKNGGHGNK